MHSHDSKRPSTDRAAVTSAAAQQQQSAQHRACNGHAAQYAQQAQQHLVSHQQQQANVAQQQHLVSQHLVSHQQQQQASVAQVCGEYQQQQQHGAMAMVSASMPVTYPPVTFPPSTFSPCQHGASFGSAEQLLHLAQSARGLGSHTSAVASAAPQPSLAQAWLQEAMLQSCAGSMMTGPGAQHTQQRHVPTSEELASMFGSGVVHNMHSNPHSAGHGVHDVHAVHGRTGGGQPAHTSTPAAAAQKKLHPEGSALSAMGLQGFLTPSSAPGHAQHGVAAAHSMHGAAAAAAGTGAQPPRSADALVQAVLAPPRATGGAVSAPAGARAGATEAAAPAAAQLPGSCSADAACESCGWHGA